MKYEILKIWSVDNKEAAVEVSGRNEILTRIKLSDIKFWFGVDEENRSVQYTIKVGQWIECDGLTKFGSYMINPRFTDGKE